MQFLSTVPVKYSGTTLSLSYSTRLSHTSIKNVSREKKGARANKHQSLHKTGRTGAPDSTTRGSTRITKLNCRGTGRLIDELIYHHYGPSGRPVEYHLDGWCVNILVDFSVPEPSHGTT